VRIVYCVASEKECIVPGSKCTKRFFFISAPQTLSWTQRRKEVGKQGWKERERREWERRIIYFPLHEIHLSCLG